MKRKIILLILTAGLSYSLIGCSGEYIKMDTETPSVSIDKTTGLPNLSQTLDVVDEDFKLVCDYDIGNYSLENWRVTDSKSIGMKVRTENLPDGYDVVIDHVHADISLMSTSAQLNGITQDSMDDTYHGSSQEGFHISNSDEYYNIFAIEGYTEQFYELWGSAFGNYGSMSSSYERLTESNIIQTGTYAEKLNVIYDLSIKKPGSDKYYTKSVKNTIAIPISQNVTIKNDDGTIQDVNPNETEDLD